MGQKVHPHGFRLGIHKGWSSNWFVSTKDLPFLIEEDNRVRRFLKKELMNAGVSHCDIVVLRPIDRWLNISQSRITTALWGMMTDV